jgi:hypothetical protein
MMHHKRLEHRFVEHLPERLEAGVLYISMEYATVAHCCCCGCGEEVVTPFTSTDWSMTFDGETVSLSPSIGNWNFACRSHYFIRHGHVIKASTWGDEQIKDNRRKDIKAKATYYSKPQPINTVKPTQVITSQTKVFNHELRKWILCKGNNLVQKMARWFKKL